MMVKGENLVDWEAALSEAPEWFLFAFWDEELEWELDRSLPLGIV